MERPKQKGNLGIKGSDGEDLLRYLSREGQLKSETFISARNLVVEDRNARIKCKNFGINCHKINFCSSTIYDKIGNVSGLQVAPVLRGLQYAGDGGRRRGHCPGCI